MKIVTKLTTLVLLALVTSTLMNCSTEEDPIAKEELPVLSAVTLTNYDWPNGANVGDVTANATVTVKDGVIITEKGFVVSFIPDGVLNNTGGGGSVSGTEVSPGVFMGDILLTEKTIYYIRAYATTSLGTAHGDVLTLDTSNE
jgi:hypothetical protein